MFCSPSFFIFYVLCLFCPSSILTDTPDAAPFFSPASIHFFLFSFCFHPSVLARLEQQQISPRFHQRQRSFVSSPFNVCVCVFCVAASKFRNFWEVAFEGSISLVPSRRKKKCTLNVCRNLLPCQRGERRWSFPPSKEKQQPSHKGLQLS